MPLSAASGSISLAQEYLRLMLADVTAFRTWVGAATQAAALARIHPEALPPPRRGGQYTLVELHEYRPFALIATEAYRKLWRASGDPHEFSEEGEHSVYFEADVPSMATQNPGEVGRVWENTIGAIVDGLVGLAGKAGYLSLRRIEVGPWQRVHPDLEPTYGDAIFGVVKLDWGMEA